MSAPATMFLRVTAMALESMRRLSYLGAGRATRAEFAMLPATESEGEPLKRGRRPGLPPRRVEVNINRALNELRFRCR
jgi:hypothetical protein